MTQVSFLRSKRVRLARQPGLLLIGPYDPHCGEYTFVAPPLGVWRLQGVLAGQGIETEVFDPNCCDGEPRSVLRRLLAAGRFDLIGVSTTGMTLRFDLELAWLARRACPDALIVAGGMEATFAPETMFETGPFDCVVLGEGERPLRGLAAHLREGSDPAATPGTAWPGANGEVVKHCTTALPANALREAIFQTPYEAMPYTAYWEKLEQAYRVAELPVKADREARLAETRAVRLNTLNYCPMNCSFCSSTNFLHAAQGGASAKIARLDADDCLAMVERIVNAQPGVRTIIFQDDIFCFTKDHRLLELCAAIVAAKARGHLPPGLRFISTNRVDAMTPERLHAMREAGFAVLGFGIENFSLPVLQEFNKGQIHRHIAGVLDTTLRAGMTPFLDIILSSPRSGVGDLAENVRQLARWVGRGCEAGAYPYVIPFSGAHMAQDPELAPHTEWASYRIAGTDRSLRQGTRILPLDPVVRRTVAAIEREAQHAVERLSEHHAHVPSRVRSLLWVQAAIPALRALGERMPGEDVVAATLLRFLGGASRARTRRHHPKGPDRREALADTAAMGSVAGLPAGAAV